MENILVMKYKRRYKVKHDSEAGKKIRKYMDKKKTARLPNIFTIYKQRCGAELKASDD